MKRKLARIFLIIVLVPIFLFTLVDKVNAGCCFFWSGPDPVCTTDRVLSCGPANCTCYPSGGGNLCETCHGGWRRLDCCDNCGQCTGGCFVEGTEVATKELKDGETEKLKNIENLEPGEIVSSFNPETGEISESQVSEVHKVTREGYYELETESGKKVKVTGEHPFLAVKSEENLISKLKNALSNTLTFRLITGLQAKLVEILD